MTAPEPLPPLVDSHAHLNMPQFDHDREEVFARFLAAGGHVLLHASVDLPSARAARDFAAHHDRTHFLAGMHPHNARELAPGEWGEMAELLAHPRCAGLGEIGLDYHYNHAPPEAQRALYAEQLRFAAEHGRPAVVHAREADADIIAGAQPFLRDLPPGILHCFSGSPALADAFLPHGWFISVAGPVTYPKAEALRRAVRGIPADRLLTETDAPYLAPQQHRGRRNEPAFIAAMLPVLAEITGATPAALAAQVAGNMLRFLARVGPGGGPAAG